MSINLNRISVSNFRGIERADISFSRVNYFVAENGVGKTSCLAAIARLFPILREEERVFLDADFRIMKDHQASSIIIDYWFNYSNEEIGTEELRLTVRAERHNTGGSKSHLNAQNTVPYSLEKGGSSTAWKTLSETAIEKGRQRVIRNGWAGNRICPVNLKRGPLDGHAATSFNEESGASDGFRARMVALLNNTNEKETVERDYPKLEETILGSFNSTISHDPLVGFSAEASSSQIAAVRKSGVTTSFDCLSGGEIATINLAMSQQFIETNAECDFIFVEEPEACFHPNAQSALIDMLLSYFEGQQFFISSHSPFIFENMPNDASIALGKYDNDIAHWENLDRSSFLFGHTSMSELSYLAYNHATFDYMNQIFGFIQAREGKSKIADMDQFLFESGIERNKVWQRDNGNSRPVTLPTFVRNFVHHPENQRNMAFTKQELSQAIELLRGLL